MICVGECVDSRHDGWLFARRGRSVFDLRLSKMQSIFVSRSGDEIFVVFYGLSHDSVRGDLLLDFRGFFMVCRTILCDMIDDLLL